MQVFLLFVSIWIKCIKETLQHSFKKPFCVCENVSMQTLSTSLQDAKKSFGNSRIEILRFNTKGM